MSYTIIRHPSVEDDLLEITDYIASYAGLAVGRNKVDEIVAFIDSLADYPKIGSLRNEISAGLRAIPAAGKATVCFKVDDERKRVVIVCISYAGSDWTSRVKDRS
ncbi:type II toxin-antitoxin system RelE/ParE family toxin [Neorhizobium sp. NPDC001467]|uniref:type II toxin-antitoxin system RelE/ParE family toxin n=1 Tax=Neorhizobium sp. NPDC001467 TaxID=3390595 RepID=UPI003D044658